MGRGERELWPQTGSRIGIGGREICRSGSEAEVGKRYKAVEKFFVKFHRVSEIFGVKEKPLAPPKLERLRGPDCGPRAVLIGHFK